jgi:hypothetical protein
MILYIKILVYYVILYDMTILNIMTRYNRLKIALVSTDTTSLPISAYHRCPGLKCVCRGQELRWSVAITSWSRARPCLGLVHVRRARVVGTPKRGQTWRSSRFDATLPYHCIGWNARPNRQADSYPL